MASLFQTLRDGLDRLTGKQKFQILVAMIAMAATVWGISLYATRVRYGTLLSHLDPAEAANVVEALADRQVPYRLTAGGSSVEVPFEQIDELRLELAGEGILPGGGVGFEIFDKPAFGLSDFVQNVNYRRALERELSRTIGSLSSVESARVHLALPPESVFADERREPSASVVVRLSAGGSLTSMQVRAITAMVASGVEGLGANKVSVVDGNGRLLSDESLDGGSGLSALQVERRRGMEQALERRLVSILEPLVGPGRVRARATVELSMTRIDRVEERFDPDGAVLRSEQKSKSENFAGGPAGTPGTATNLPGGSGTLGGSAGGSGKSQSSTTNFEINKTVSTIREPVGALERQSIAVVVDHVLEPAADGTSPPTPRPRTPEEMRQITDLVRGAIGFDPQRGDSLIVENAPFDEAMRPGPEVAPATDIWPLLFRLARYLSVPLAVLLLALLVIRPGIAALRGLGQTAVPGALAEGGVTVEELQAQISAGSGAAMPAGGSSGLRDKLLEAAAHDPKTAALLVRDWLEPKGQG